MRICRFNDNRVGLVRDDHVYDVTAALSELGTFSYPLPRFDPMIAQLPKLMPLFEEIAKTATPIKLSSVKLLSPVANPGKIVAAPVNYQAHLDEAIAEKETFSRHHVRQIHETGLFLKSTSSVVGPGEGVELRFPDRRSDHEIELGVVIGKAATNVSAANALDIVAGYLIGLDMTVRGPEERSLRKSVDTYTVLGPWFVTADELSDPSNLSFELSVNGEVRQSANTRDLVIDTPGLIEFASKFYTLEVGDILLTGTPEGVGPVKPGDRISATIERIGSMDVEVR
ncbi:fumarylacetoacetate hydrolase family protein [Pseudorhodoplanes sinuspersici]|uniref:2-hydroxyhepta-2,4-diene-1,7-dioate isomerase n=1 Tax=Pseudorhodoplanes sinuspersici TaxID=1235591 RepID=A0A1W6ZT95_9HYPH|nr:fumarylacetoacetate hydrolase family protein [Pseudorhodoplanes sinuspersici]ARQ00553.1 2-hydroxyhepta-2,4-diene-1,7-dioate isomerase [Pseudorhodoplanes sinuspersici]RKE72145.1 2-keto-4-pentenoate hydratase/2-oxohepta-3-ene-1,7-dioic acid hydratase in catechol pathway [Pseudorhodoplanes sinuspersici]